MLNIIVFKPVVHEKTIFKDLSNFPFLPLKWPLKYPAPWFVQIWIPITQECFLPSFLPKLAGGSWEEVV